MPEEFFRRQNSAALARFLIVAVVCAAICAGASAQTADKTAAPAPRPAATPTADQILDRYVAAIGGREAWKKLNSRVSTGTIDIPTQSISGTVDFREKAPNKLLHTIVLNGATFRQGYDGAVAWTDDPRDGLRAETGDELADTKIDSDFYHPLDLRKLYSKFTVTGTEKIGERDTYVVEAARAGADPEQLYFDTESGLVLRILSRRHTSEALMSFEENLEDYRDVDGVKLPFTVHQRAKPVAKAADSTEDQPPEISFTIQFSEVRHNVDLDDQQFSKPAAQ